MSLEATHRCTELRGKCRLLCLAAELSAPGMHLRWRTECCPEHWRWRRARPGGAAATGPAAAAPRRAAPPSPVSPAGCSGRRPPPRAAPPAPKDRHGRRSHTFAKAQQQSAHPASASKPRYSHRAGLRVRRTRQAGRNIWSAKPHRGADELRQLQQLRKAHGGVPVQRRPPRPPLPLLILVRVVGADVRVQHVHAAAAWHLDARVPKALACTGPSPLKSCKIVSANLLRSRLSPAGRQHKTRLARGLRYLRQAFRRSRVVIAPAKKSPWWGAAGSPATAY